MMSIPQTQKTLKITKPGQIEPVPFSAIPQIGPDEVLVQVAYVAINPFDGKSADLSPTVGATVGCDFAGKVVALGSAVTRDFSIGDRVCGCVFGNNPDRLQNGAFAEFVAAPADLLLKIPPQMSFQAAATLGVGVATVGMALYHAMKLRLPGSPATGPCYVLVYGGATATGTLAIQMLQLSGLIPVTTCSPRNFDLVKSLGAAKAFDYHSPTCGDQIRDFTGNKLVYALDCITDTGSMKICYEAIGSAGGQYLSLDPFPIRGHTRRSVKPNWILSLTMYNEPINWKRPFKRDARPQDREFARSWFQIAQSLLDANEIKPHPHQMRSGGLERVIDGIDAVRKGEVSGTKLVYQVQQVVC
ncbi:hypothetical protein VTN77DRAFT_9274 [Rasamsonia byssochlamydoides]|uniref:uncharacterized protein n=1 Tax=Rasamsonia byssochlamydoides TaxID=89139 RepID=UPI003742CDC6